MTCMACKGNTSEVSPLYYGIALEVAQISAVTLEIMVRYAAGGG